MRIIIAIIVLALLYEAVMSYIKRKRRSSGNAEKNSAASYHEILGISLQAGPDEIKKAYRDKIKEYHPDKFHNQPEWVKQQAADMMQKINEAYEKLK